MFEEIISIENLLAAWQEFLRGKRKKRDVQAFGFQLADNIIQLHSDLANGRYRHGPYRAFMITDPKPRNIHKASVRDRLLHHAIHRILYPHFDKKFIADSFSCRINKGTHAALNKFKRGIYKVSQNDTRTCWVLKCDIRRYFASINHDILINSLKRLVIDEKVIDLLREIIGSFNSGVAGKGIPLGNLTSQLFANVYLNELDQYIKHSLKIRHYIRYADDFVIFSNNKKLLEELIPRLQQYLADKLKLELHPKKVSIETIASGVDFLGWVNFSDHLVLRSVARRRMIKRIKDHPTNETIQSYLGLLQHGNTFLIKCNLENIYNNENIS